MTMATITAAALVAALTAPIPGMTTIVIGILRMIGNGDAQTEWQIVMAMVLLAILPPVLVVLL